MNSSNINFNKISVTNLTGYFANAITLYKVKKQQKKLVRLEKVLLEKRKFGLLEEERLSPADSRCNQNYVEKVSLLSYCIGIGEDGEQCATAEQKVTYIDGTYKMFKVTTSVSSISVVEIKEETIIVKTKLPANN